MKRLTLVFLSLLLLAAPSLFAQRSLGRIGVAARIVWVDPTQDDDHGINGRINFGGSTGFAIAADAPLFPRFSVELEAATIPMDASLKPADGLGEIAMGKLAAKSFTASARYHFFRGGAFDAFAGLGVSYATFGSLHSGALRDQDITRVSLSNSVAPAVDAGLNIGQGRIGFSLDVKYRQYKTDSRATFIDGDRSDKSQWKIDPLTVGAGVIYRF